MKMGTMKINKPIEGAIREIREWLEKIGISGLMIDSRYDAAQNIALVRFNFKGKQYEFRSTKQNNCRLNMWGIAKVMEFKVRAHLMGIEEFETSMKSYLRLEAPQGYSQPNQAVHSFDEKSYAVLGISPLASNDEVERKYKQLAKGFHPDMALSEEAKSEFSKRFSEINQAYSEIKRVRGL